MPTFGPLPARLPAESTTTDRPWDLGNCTLSVMGRPRRAIRARDGSCIRQRCDESSGAGGRGATGRRGGRGVAAAAAGVWRAGRAGGGVGALGGGGRPAGGAGCGDPDARRRLHDRRPAAGGDTARGRRHDAADTLVCRPAGCGHRPRRAGAARGAAARRRDADRLWRGPAPDGGAGRAGRRDADDLGGRAALGRWTPVAGPGRLLARRACPACLRDPPSGGSLSQPGCAGPGAAPGEAGHRVDRVGEERAARRGGAARFGAGGACRDRSGGGSPGHPAVGRPARGPIGGDRHRRPHRRPRRSRWGDDAPAAGGRDVSRHRHLGR